MSAPILTALRARIAHSPRAPAPGARTRAMRWIRKIHMYLGLALFPWIIFFGVSGMLFNHPGVGEDVRARPIPAEHLREHAGITPMAPRAVAEDVVAALRAEGHSLRLDDEYESRFQGSLAFGASGPGVKHLVLVDPAAGRGLLLSRPDHTAAPPPFAGTIDLPDHRISDVEARIASLLPTLGVDDAHGPLRARIAPSVRFRTIDADGHRWNVTYDLRTGRVDGRLTERSPALSLHDLLGAMHKTHHYPPSLGPTTFWALFADLTGLTLIIWALTGLVMWWQLKKTRALGVIAVSVGVLVAALTMVATHDELRFGNVRPEEPGRASD